VVRTQAAGLVGAHVAASRDGLAVVSVLGPVDVDRAGVLAAAHEVALGLDGTRIGRIGQWVSLFDVPAGRSDLGEIVEETVTITRGSTEAGCAVLPTWHASTQLNRKSKVRGRRQLPAEGSAAGRVVIVGGQAAGCKVTV
jgi:hypothetical protein